MTVISSDRTDPQTGFSEAIKAASWSLHEKAEQSTFMDELLAGNLPIDRYADLTVQHYFIYQTLEEAAVVMRDEPLATPFIKDELTRLPSLETDLRFLIGEDWAEKISQSPSTAAYCDRMREVCFSWPGGFVAHHYVRYMGDLSGGQAIRKTVERVYGLKDHVGTQFYVFDAIPDLREFKDNYRDSLDAALWGPVERGRIVDEILLAYEFNTRVLNEL